MIVLNFHHRRPVWCCAGARSPNFIKFPGKNFQVVTADPSKVCCSETGPVVSLGVARCALTVRWSFGACCRIGFGDFLDLVGLVGPGAIGATA